MVDFMLPYPFIRHMAASGDPKKKKSPPRKKPKPAPDYLLTLAAEKNPDLSPEEINIVYPIPYNFGRPTKYNHGYCQQIVEWGRQGKPFPYFCDMLGISLKTFYNWVNAWPEFKDAYEVSKMRAQTWHEHRNISYQIEEKDGPKLNVGLYKYYMSGHFKETYAAQDSGQESKAPTVVEDPESIKEIMAGLGKKLRDGNPKS